MSKEIPMPPVVDKETLRGKKEIWEFFTSTDVATIQRNADAQWYEARIQEIFAWFEVWADVHIELREGFSISNKGLNLDNLRQFEERFGVKK